MIFVTGGTGLLGNNIVRELCQRGLPVRALVRKGSDMRPLAGLDVELIEGELADREQLQRGIEGCNAAIHCAAYIHLGWKNLEKSRQINVEGTRGVAEVCAAQGARLLHVSSVDALPTACDAEHPIDESGERGVPNTPCSYVISKRESEAMVDAYVREKDLDAVIFQPGFMLGPHDWKPSSGKMIQEVARLKLVAAPPGGCSVCDVRDVANAIVDGIGLARKGEHYILGGANMTYQALWHLMREAVGRPTKVYRLGPSLRWFARAVDIGLGILPVREGDVNGASIAMGCLFHYYDSSKAARELNYHSREPQVSLNDAWQWMAEQRS
ncbi:NAD-dependent epimerase/dehydratase family protein [Aureliella helgolandensis]|uniref:dTDP-4-oxo-6-deoxy-D-allose reductase n=1 Tax=Aureliella helgolandensis TaxID=2527968 RepID=A0A518G4Z8_9BACT|nr:NAD-dependent epimerase/dehydratase family protein [Aureliella helgolandensis]QDV23671.1 dTDP-4-oxo-6-deoxy-D-allose reductase [Aureliella helgolandensis]